MKKGGRNWEKWVGNDRNDAEVHGVKYNNNNTC